MVTLGPMLQYIQRKLSCLYFLVRDQVFATFDSENISALIKTFQNKVILLVHCMLVSFFPCTILFVFPQVCSWTCVRS